VQTLFHAVAAMVLVAVCTGTAVAKDICVMDNSGSHWRFYDVEAPKPGRTIRLTGAYGIGISGCPMMGTAILTKAGELRVGLTVYCGAPVSSSNLLITLTGTPDFKLTGKYDGDLDAVADNGVIIVMPEDCATAPLP
jgi:hypothetical protein